MRKSNKFFAKIVINQHFKFSSVYIIKIISNKYIKKIIKKLCKITHKIYKSICTSKIISNQFNTSKNPNTSNTLCK